MPAKEGKHTPGPWMYDAGDLTIMTDDEANVTIATVETDNCDDMAHAEADARLMAAAPDLLAALRDCLESLERLPNTEGAYRVTCIAQARAALLKAQGKE